MTRKGRLQCRKQGNVLLAERREGAANAAKASHPFLSMKTSGDLLLYFHHVQITLGLVVIEGHGKIQQEVQHVPLGPVLRQLS